MNELAIPEDIAKARKARRGKHFPSTIACFGHGGFFMTYSLELNSALGRKFWWRTFHGWWQVGQRTFGYCWNHRPRINT